MRRDRKTVIRYVDRPLHHELLHYLRCQGIEATPQSAREFHDWLINEQWQKYQDAKMNTLNQAEAALASLQLLFPNARKGEKYCHTVEFPADVFESVTVDGLPDGCGLEAAIDGEGKLCVKGIPVSTLETTLRINVKPFSLTTPLHREVQFIVNPDPWDMWKTIEPADNLPFKKDHEACDYKLVKEFDGKAKKDIVAASKRGRSHAHEGKFRDDDFSIRFLPDSGWYILVVADGAGSARYSREGSRIAVNTVADWCGNHLNENGADLEETLAKYIASKDSESLETLSSIINHLLVDGAKQAYREIEKCKSRCEPPASMRDFATTLLVAVCREFDFGWFIASFGVGDGAIAVYDKDASDIALINEPDGGEYAGQTRFLTMSSIFSDRPRVSMRIVKDFTALMLMTDGVSDPFFETDANLRDKKRWDDLWDNINATVDLADDNENSRHQLLSWLDFRSPGNHDDRTIAILY